MQLSDIQSIVRDERLFTYAFEHAAIGMALVAPNGKWLMVNQALCSLFGLTENELLASSFQNITHPDDLISDLEHIHDLLSGKMNSYQKEKRYIHNNGDIIHALLSVSLVRDESDKPLFLISQIQDITEQKKLENELLKQAKQDPLTGLCNRRCFLEQATREIARIGRYNEPATLLMLDIDHFKKINDTYGHAVGDEALRVMVETCAEVLRPYDIFSRIGGEEFAILLVKANLKVGQYVSERLREAVEKITIPHKIGPLQFTISIGGIAFIGNEPAITYLMEQADSALYEAKSSGRNRVILKKDPSYELLKDQLTAQGFIRLQWQDGYECGHEMIDEQHKELFNKANKLLATVSSKKEDQETTLAAMDNLLADVIDHFKQEEMIMQTIDYPFVNQHTKIHTHLINKAQSLAINFQQQKSGLAEALQFIAIDVVHDHLLREDRKFFPYINPGLCNS